jgi:predicted transcriptional regulator
MYRCSLSYDQLVRYLAFMRTQGLLARNETGQFHLTPRGESAFDHVAGVLAILLDLEHDGSGAESKTMETREAAYGD